MGDSLAPSFYYFSHCEAWHLWLEGFNDIHGNHRGTLGWVGVVALREPRLLPKVEYVEPVPSTSQACDCWDAKITGRCLPGQSSESGRDMKSREDNDRGTLPTHTGFYSFPRPTGFSICKILPLVSSSSQLSCRRFRILFLSKAFLPHCWRQRTGG